MDAPSDLYSNPSLEIGRTSDRVTASNLSDWERDCFVNAVGFIDNLLSKKIAEENKSALGRGGERISPKSGERTYGLALSSSRRYTRLRYFYESLVNLVSLVDGKEDEVFTLLQQYEEALNFTIFFNRTQPEESLLEASLVTDRDGMIMVNFTQNLSKDFRKGGQQEKFQNQLSELKKRYASDAKDQGKDGNTVKFSIIKSNIQDREQKEIDLAIEEHNQESQLRYKMLTLNSYISLHDEDGVKESIEEFKKAGIYLSKLEEIAKNTGEPFPLFHAMENHANLDIVKLLVESGCNPAYEDTNNNGTASIFYSACKYCKLDVVEYLYKKLGNPDLNKIKGYFGETPLHGVIRKIEPLIDLKSLGAQILGGSGDGDHVIGRKSQSEKMVIVEFLIKKGASFDAVNDKEKKPNECFKDESIRKIIEEAQEKYQEEGKRNNEEREQKLRRQGEEKYPSDGVIMTPSPEPRQPIEAISLKEKHRVFNIFNKQHSDSELSSKYSPEQIKGLKREFKNEQEKINKDISDKEFLNPKRYSGIGIKAQYEYIKDSQSQCGGRWEFDIEEVFENSPAHKIGFKPGELIKVEGREEALKEIVQKIRDGELEISKSGLKTPTSVFELNERTNKYELFNFEKSFQPSVEFTLGLSQI